MLVVGLCSVAAILLVACILEARYQRLLTYRKVGGIHFVTIGCVGFNFYMRRAKSTRTQAAWVVQQQLVAE
jgi:hypothetical protein